ncbi:AEC family transporter [Haloarcula salinisoli]|uniref:AEC family transporter n=1 Tax=Haloarcula salinisoli TaxID=2487746 RepID=A0A8J8CDG7_9EURY|nr:AEC family transporter [Halomicroarcula salinisoli]MBX0287686.1 AEC family transporter [Halomicroarcula salinisoli]MBX0304615.1 AEC family transporter [Halomicroarcula salinisoli]
MAVIEQLGFMLVFLAVGAAARSVSLLTASRTETLTAVAFYVALPALVFASTFDRPLGELISPALLVGFWTVLAVTVAAGWLVHRRRESDARRSVAIVQSYHGNMGFLGLPLVAATLGGEATAIASVVLGLGALTQAPVTVMTLIRINDSDASLSGELRALATNPVLVSLAAGIAASVGGVGVPAPVVTGLDTVATLALPLALVCVGAKLDTELSLSTLRPTTGVVLLKVVWMPVLAWAVFSALGVGSTALSAAVIMLGVPTAVSTYVYTSELGGDAAFASMNVVVTTVASLGTLSVLVWLFG